MTTLPAPDGHRYSAVAIALHWLIAAAIIAQIAMGWIMGDLETGDPARLTLFQLHKSVGITVLVLSAARVVWRLMNKPPREPEMPGWQRTLSSTVHIAFYVLIIAMPLTGWLMVSTADQRTPTILYGLVHWPDAPGLADLSGEARHAVNAPLENIHSKLAWVAIVLLVLHVGGALKHQFIDKDGLLARMAPGLFGRTQGPSQRPRGALYAFGAAALVLIGGLSLGMLSPSAPLPVQTPASQAASDAPRWAIDKARSRIAFSTIYSNRPITGAFRDWDADIRFDPAKPETGAVSVTITMGSADTGEAYYNDSLKAADWFNIRSFPTATFEIAPGGIAKAGAGYVAQGTLSVKAAKVPVSLPFTLATSGATATMHGEVSLKRLALGVGAATKTDAKAAQEWVSDDINVVIDVVATRQ